VSQTNGQASQADEQARDVAGDADEGQKSSGEQQSSSPKTITSELKETFREAAIEVLKPVMRKATTRPRNSPSRAAPASSKTRSL
jgi:hypothetical protein